MTQRKSVGYPVKSSYQNKTAAAFMSEWFYFPDHIPFRFNGMKLIDGNEMGKKGRDLFDCGGLKF